MQTIEETIDQLCKQYDNAMHLKDWKLALILVQLLDIELSKMDNDEIKITLH